VLHTPAFINRRGYTVFSIDSVGV